RRNDNERRKTSTTPDREGSADWSDEMDAVHMGFAPVTGDAEDLCWYWNDMEAAMGMGSSHGVAVNRSEGLSGGAVESCSTYEEGACWSTPDATRAREVGTALRCMPQEHVQVLYAAYGPKNPAARTDILADDIARVAPYTPVIEQARCRRARRLSGE